MFVKFHYASNSMRRSARLSVQPGKTATITQLVVFPSGPQQASLPFLILHLLLELLSHGFLKMLSHLMSFDSLLWTLKRATRSVGSNQIQTSPQFLRKLVRVLHKCLIIGSGFSYSLIATLILIGLYSCSADLSPHPLLLLEDTTPQRSREGVFRHSH